MGTVSVDACPRVANVVGVADEESTGTTPKPAEVDAAGPVCEVVGRLEVNTGGTTPMPAGGNADGDSPAVGNESVSATATAFARGDLVGSA
jgi:hypothetical protein